MSPKTSQNLNKWLDSFNTKCFIVLNAILDSIQFILLFLLVLIVYNDDKAAQTLTLQIALIPPLCFAIIAHILAIILTKHTDYNSRVECIFINLFILFYVEFFIIVLPNFGSIFMYDGYRGRIMDLAQKKATATQVKRFEYVQHILEYCINNHSKQPQIYRIIATNYYLQTMLHQILSSERCKQERMISLKKMRNLHQNGYKNVGTNITNICWKDILNGTIRENMDNHNTKQKYCYMLLLYSIITNCVQYSIAMYHYGYFFWLLLGYGMIQFFNHRIHCKYYKIELYLYHILPVVPVHTLYNINWNRVFPSKSGLINDIDIIYEIMFDQLTEIQCVYQSMDNDDIAGIIVQFLWFPLPNEANMDEELQLFYQQFSIGIR